MFCLYPTSTDAGRFPLMARAPLGFRLHAVVAFGLIARCR
jgi:hypothetical protein